ncbi:unnamed protein product [Timema podura]|uniref:Uncharacterized protein n=1 Tax=Timema podura TaxID=61482 RepID=A0ABN7P4N5_TIMPD|nr:unnamed protein product [Timema podura]
MVEQRLKNISLRRKTDISQIGKRLSKCLEMNWLPKYLTLRKGQNISSEW